MRDSEVLLPTRCPRVEREAGSAPDGAAHNPPSAQPILLRVGSTRSRGLHYGDRLAIVSFARRSRRGESRAPSTPAGTALRSARGRIDLFLRVAGPRAGRPSRQRAAHRHAARPPSLSEVEQVPVSHRLRHKACRAVEATASWRRSASCKGPPGTVRIRQTRNAPSGETPISQGATRRYPIPVSVTMSLG